MCFIAGFVKVSWLILWIVTVCATHWTHSTAVGVLIVALTAFGSPPTHPPLIHTICDITIAVKKVAQNPAVLAT